MFKDLNILSNLRYNLFEAKTNIPEIEEVSS